MSPIEMLVDPPLANVLDDMPPIELLEDLLLVDVLDDVSPGELLEKMPLVVDEVDCRAVEDEEEVSPPTELGVVELPTLPTFDVEVLDAPETGVTVTMSRGDIRMPATWF